MTNLEKALLPLRRAMRRQRAAEWAWIGLGVGAVCALLLRAASFLWPFPHLAAWTGAALAGMPLLCGAIAWFWPIPWMDAARGADECGLQARAQTALMLHDSHTPMAELQRQDALRCLKDMEPKKAFPLRAPRSVLAGVAACAMLYGLSWFLPNPQASVLEQRAAFQQEMEKQAALVDEGAVKLDAKDGQTPELRRVLGDLSLTLRKAQEPRAALTAVDEAERRIEGMQTVTRKQTLSALKNNGMSELAQALQDKDGEKAEQLLREQNASELADSLKKAGAEAVEGAASQALNLAAASVMNGQLAQALAQLQAAAAGTSAMTLQAAALSGMVRAAIVSDAGQRAALGMAGSQGASGQGGMGLGLAAGQGMGQGAGQGSSNKDGGYQEASGSARSASTRQGSPKTGAYETIYDPTRLNRAGEAVAAPGKVSEGEITQVTAGVGEGSVEESVPYRQVFDQYQAQAVQAVQSAELPAYAKQWVQEYFAALEDEY